jgi:hypothetical protein
LSDKFKPVKENSVNGGYIMTSKGNWQQNEFNKESTHPAGIIDIDLLVATVNAAKSTSDLEPAENILESIKRGIDAYSMALDIQENNVTVPDLINDIKKKKVVAHCEFCNTNFKDSGNKWVPTDEPATDTMDDVIETQPVDKTPLKKKSGN